MENITIWQNSQVPLLVTQGDPDSLSATIVLSLQDDSIVLTVTKTANFVDVDGTMTADLTLDAADTATEGVYEYQILENFASEDPLVYPDPDSCDGDCELPTITICESLADEVS